MRRTRRSTALRTAAVLTGAAAVLALPVGSAFADSPTVPEPEVLPGVEQPVVDPSVEPPVKPSEKPVEKPVEKPGKGRVYVTTVKLADGSVAKVYRFGDGHFEADVFARGTKLDTLVSRNGKPAHGQNNGLHVVLQPNGTVTSWIEGGSRKPVEKPVEKPKPHVKRETSVRITMPDGRIARLIDGPNGKRAEISMPNGNLLGTIDMQNRSALNDGWTYKLVQDGKRVKFVVIDGKGGGDSWVYDFSTGKLIEQYKAEKPAKAEPSKFERVVPKGGVNAGAGGSAPETDTPLLLAAGGGMAATGAAGLGFAMLRRNRTDG
ncbi:hypothetical protein QEZ40_002951 [Streptomyces katrae]|uniref:Gram-positive cocci surface proteins LPxTG domain-containing protein n=1 Tax=Streptomyces katrae TaxID=68223 RepID=A0ABT7GWM2_9ACTN|nr:hypothetical protein [Streptomyces katrae]MDK9498005.1 hypothetical protein [Streptomyces katrae]